MTPKNLIRLIETNKLTLEQQNYFLAKLSNSIDRYCCSKPRESNKKHDVVQSVSKPVKPVPVTLKTSKPVENKNYSVYLVEMQDIITREKFHKIGASTRSALDRFHGMPYKVTTIRRKRFNERKDMYAYEKSIHNLLSSYRYSPVYKFGGSKRECYVLPYEMLMKVSSLLN